MRTKIQTTNLKKMEKEIMTCTMCGFCKAVCPTGEELSWDSSTARGRVILSYGLLEGEIPLDISVLERLYQCMVCLHCKAKCPSKIDVGKIILSARKDIFNSGKILKRHEEITENIMKYGNPYAEKFPRMQNFNRKVKESKLAYFMGCNFSYRNQDIAKSTFSLLDKLKIDFTPLDEICCGSVLYMFGGDDEKIKKLMKENFERIKKTKAEKVIFTCPGCYRMVNETYREINNGKLDFAPLHITQFLENIEMKLKPLNKKITYHDPCHLGRHSGIYEQPRKIIAKIPNIVFKEMEQTKEMARCCGGGGGVRSAFPELTKILGKKRVEQGSFADILLSTCPFCVDNLKLGNELANKKLEIKHITEVLDELIEG